MSPSLRLLPVERSRTFLVEVEIEPLDQAAHVLPVHAAAQVGEVAQGLLAGEVAVERELTGQEADPAPHGQAVAAAVQAEHGGPAGRGPDEVEQHADGRGLAGAVGAEVAEDVACADLEVEIHHAAVSCRRTWSTAR